MSSHGQVDGTFDRLCLCNGLRKTLPLMTKVAQGRSTKKRRYHPYERERQGRIIENRKGLPGRTFLMAIIERAKESNSFHHDQPRASSHMNDNYCVTKLQARLTDNKHLFKCKLSSCTFCSYCTQTFPKERTKSRVSSLLWQRKQIKICEKCFLCHSIVLCKTYNKCRKCCHKSACRDQTSKLLKNLAGSGCRSESRSNPERGLHPPLSDLAKLDKGSHRHKLLCRSHRNSYLLEASHQLMDKNEVGLVNNQTSLGFFNRLFLVPKPNNKWRPILDLSNFNQFLKAQKFKMETPETIRTSLQQGEWVTSIDFKDAYFHTPIQEQSRIYLRFHIQGRTYQFKALPFGLSTAPMEFTVIAKEVKIMATQKGMRIHQYLDDWLVRARSHQVCLQHTRVLVQMCQQLGWVVNLEKSELEPKQIFNFVGYQFDLRVGRAGPHRTGGKSFKRKYKHCFLLLPACPVRQFMSLIGLLTATEKQVHLGRLHMRPILWHLKNNWRENRSLWKK